ncbi:hypothetical protein [Acinetobacter wuhouensis]|uniref:Uncharacterized protein n=1 Tax=Acinetobacter wuhouensis TaxID=1879050 RepID=A0A4Q7AK29_9GAMM|nr:hypothetical protein [Acinetobacter wuhouensis]RZG49142.1 hypothetical protein EXU28_02065 [Acinetobacter wuhouensis]
MKLIRLLLNRLRNFLMKDFFLETEKQKLIMGEILAKSVKSNNNILKLSDAEFSIFSQFGDDGIIQYLINNIEIDEKIFIEFGVENYLESNTRFLMMNDNWSGLVLDGCKKNIHEIVNSYYFWKYDLYAEELFINKDNINSYLGQYYEGDIGLLHIDLDGNDYYILDAIESVSPVILILEYNSLFGIDRPISIPYDEGFYRTNAHYSNLYWGASLKSLYDLANEKGYSFLGCNSAGNNSYFVRNDKLNGKISPITLEEGFVNSRYRESRNKKGELTFLNKSEQRDLIKGLKVFNTNTKKLEIF